MNPTSMILKTMRLLFVSHSFPLAGKPMSNVGGMQRVATELHDALLQHPQVDFTPLVLRTSWQWTHFNSVPFLAKALWRIGHMANRREIDIVLFSSMVTASLTVALHKKLASNNIASAAIVHGCDVTLPVKAYQQFVPYVFNSLDAVLPVSQATGKECLARGLPDEKLRVVSNGIAIPQPGSLASPQQLRLNLETLLGKSFPKDGFLLCSVGRLVERKGFAWFVENVMPLLPANISYLIAGEGAHAGKINAAIKRNNLSSRVHMLGTFSQDMLEILYRGSDLFIMCNRPIKGELEGFGMVMLEAGLCGLPVIGSGIEGIQDVICEGQNGHQVESGNASAFVEAIMRYYQDSQALATLAGQTRKHVISNFSWDVISQEYVNIMTDLVKSK